MRPRGTGKEIPALLACLVWAGGFELAPALHALEHASLAPHDHDGHVHSEGEPEREHGEGSLAHRDLAAFNASPGLPPIEARFVGLAGELPCAPEPAPRVERGLPPARAPPVSLPLHPSGAVCALLAA